MNSDYSLNRRELLESLVVSGAALGAWPLVAACGTPAASASARAATAHGGVASFFMDRPYIDYSATAVPYHAPPGACSGAAAAHLSEAEFFSLRYGA